MKTVPFEDYEGTDFTLTTEPERIDPVITLEVVGEESFSVTIDEAISTQVASLILSTFGEDVGVEFHPDGNAIVHAGKGVTRVSMAVPEDSAGREELLNMAIAAMGAINGFDAKVERERQQERDVALFQQSLKDLADGIFAKLQEEEDSEDLDREALVLHNAYYDLEWTLERLRSDDKEDLKSFRRTAQAARRAYAQSVIAP